MLERFILMEWITDNWFPILLIGAFVALQLSGYGRGSSCPIGKDAEQKKNCETEDSCK
jgi:hypothetical protein